MIHLNKCQKTAKTEKRQLAGNHTTSTQKKTNGSRFLTTKIMAFSLNNLILEVNLVQEFFDAQQKRLKSAFVRTKKYRIRSSKMLTFFLCWGAASVVGTLIALSLIWSGKRTSQESSELSSRTAQNSAVAPRTLRA
ncbi:hypothetical protein QN400_24640 [Pseudomonas sp. RTC3]|uniref:hypothetical protein n=1 Tax=Pseudomonas sp. 5C2 TaxID=3048588 RepID=UPI002AB40C94|nr:hypothetical protein [Pseudomonas sp. 5C2]MDY7565974.1 hypothetical protein [Pseudomonas sp. 5C2]MEB0065190.1 hypothetical protein [Pseudomonas sp. RTC3]MEB0243491.1 hypothetical protein [Pseudomonas sp. 5C2]